MKDYRIFVCEICGKESRDRHEIIECEGSHMGLNALEYRKWNTLNRRVEKLSRKCSLNKTAETEEKLDKAIEELISYEKKVKVFQDD